MTNFKIPKGWIKVSHKPLSEEYWRKQREAGQKAMDYLDASKMALYEFGCDEPNLIVVW